MRRLVTDPGGTLRLEDAVDPTGVGPPIALERPDGTASVRAKVAAYIALTKPRIIELLLVTTVPTMIVAADAIPSLALIAAVVVGGTLSAAGANAINCYLDRDIDAVMPRTKRRPLPTHRIEPRNALLFGSALGAVAFAFLWVTVNLLSALLATAALLFYVFVYTMAMKRWSPQNIVIGGAAGAAPVLVGWAAITGELSLEPLALFGIVFYWTPPHFWALAMRYEKEYAAAGVPMMPVVYGRAETTKHILLYSLLTCAMCLVFFSVAHMGPLYLAVALVLNAVLIGWAVRLWRKPFPRIAWGLFRYSIYYLGALFVAMAADRLIF